jgi:hypothetical protein
MKPDNLIIERGAVPAPLLDHARRAVAACPVLALKLRVLQQTPGKL